VVETVALAVGVSSDIELGDRDFDRAFLVRGITARTLLGPELRKGLLALPDHAPRFELHDGRTTLSWTGSVSHTKTDLFPSAARDFLVMLRAHIACA